MGIYGCGCVAGILRCDAMAVRMRCVWCMRTIAQRGGMSRCLPGKKKRDRLSWHIASISRAPRGVPEMAESLVGIMVVGERFVSSFVFFV